MQLNAISSLALILGLGYGSVVAAEEVRNIAIIGKQNILANLSHV